MMDSKSLKLATSGALLLAAAASVLGCSSAQDHEYRAHSDRVTSGAGNAMAANRAIHTIDPWPANSQNTQIDMEGNRAQVAVRRYENNTSIKPKGASPGSNGTSNGGN